MDYSFLQVDLNNEMHCKSLIYLLDIYMLDEMGNGKPMGKDMAPRIIEGLKDHKGYLGFFVLAEGSFVALANCNKNFSSFKAMPVINIHDFVVHPNYRGKGVGKFLLDSIDVFAEQNGYCKINLEVREDNSIAQKLYLKMGYNQCSPNMYFWEKNL